MIDEEIQIKDRYYSKVSESNKGHSRSGGSVLGKCIYFWKVLVETSPTVYIIAAPIEVKGQKSGGQLLAKIQFSTFCARKT